MPGNAASSHRAATRWLALILVLAATVATIRYWSEHGADRPQDGAVTAPSTAASALSGYPDATTTGVPAGTRLTPSGAVVVEEDGAVIEGLEISGTVLVKADDVVIRNTKIVMTSGEIAVRTSGQNLLIEDSEIDGQGKANPVIAFNNYTLRRVEIHNAAEGPRIAGGNVTIEDSYIHSMVQRGDNHTDVVQVLSGDDIVLRGNNLQAYNPDSGAIGNAAFMFGEDDGQVRGCIVEGNLMNGGNYTVNGGGSDTEGAECAFRDNAFGEDSRYGAVANLGPRVSWDESNTWFTTGAPVR